MSSKGNINLFKIGLICLSVSISLCEDRKLVSEVNPGCGRGACENATLVHTRGDGPADSLHQIWDLTRGEPTIIFAVTRLHDDITFVWQNDKPVSIVCTRPPLYTFAVVIKEIWEYEDPQDAGTWRPGAVTAATRAADLAWRRRALAADATRVTLAAVAALPRAPGELALNVSWSAWTDYSERVPHLVHSSNSCVVEVSLRDAAGGGAGGGAGCRRLALLLALASLESEARAGRWTSRVRATLDDEHTPGIFESVEVVGGGGRVAYRPVSYTSPGHEVTSSTLAQLGFLNRSMALGDGGTAARWLARAGAGAADVRAQAMLVSFGSRADGCYARTNYTSWSAGLWWGGAGSGEAWSARVWAWLVASVAAPLALLLLFAAARRLRRPRLVNTRSR